MGNLCCSGAPKKRNLTFLVIGLDNSGKTTLTRTIAGGEFI
jgi:GTPase SAR1 family protein